MSTGAVSRLDAEDVRAIEAIHARWMTLELAGNAAAVLELCADEVVWLPPGGPPLRGRRTILQWLSGPPIPIQDLRLSNVAINGDGRVAWKTCEFVTTYQPYGATFPLIERGTHLWVLHKHDDGVWRVVVATWTQT